MNTPFKTILIVGAIAIANTAIAVQAAETKSAPIVGTSILGVRVDVTAVETTGFRASRLIGAAVYNDKKKEIGRVNDLIISTAGKVNLAIVDVGGFLGLGSKHVAIPSQLFKRGAKDTVVLPGATQKDLKDMPAFRFAR